MREKIITNLYVKEDEQESPYCKMQKQHLRDWSDDTRKIKEEEHAEVLSKFQKHMTQIKQSVASE